MSGHLDDAANRIRRARSKATLARKVTPPTSADAAHVAQISQLRTDVSRLSTELAEEVGKRTKLEEILTVAHTEIDEQETCVTVVKD